MDTALVDLGVILPDFDVHRSDGALVIAVPRRDSHAALRLRGTFMDVTVSYGSEFSPQVPATARLVRDIIARMAPDTQPYREESLAAVQEDADLATRATAHIAEMLGATWDADYVWLREVQTEAYHAVKAALAERHEPRTHLDDMLNVDYTDEGQLAALALRDVRPIVTRVLAEHGSIASGAL